MLEALGRYRLRKLQALLNRDLPFTRALLLNKNGVNRKLVLETERPVRAVVSIQEPQRRLRIDENPALCRPPESF